jgi:Flp pilus assembly protein TadG
MSTRRGWAARDDGRVSVFFAIALAAVIIIIGLTVDGSGRNRETERADNIAAEAARAGGQAINASQAITGGNKVVDPQLARAAAEAYLHSAGATGEVLVVDPQHLRVVVHLTYRTAMLSYIGIGQIDVTGRATAQLVTG